MTAAIGLGRDDCHQRSELDMNEPGPAPEPSSVPEPLSPAGSATGAPTSPSSDAASPTTILGVEVATLEMDEALTIVEGAIAARRSLSTDGGHGPASGLKLAFANANLLNFAATDPALRKALDSFLVLNDGIGVDMARKLLVGAPFPANLNGTDVTPLILERSRYDLRLFLLGAEPGTADEAAAAIGHDYPQHTVVGTQHGFASESEQEAIAERIGTLDVDVLMVAMGNPRQEMWIDRFAPRCQAGVMMGIGAQLDRFAGKVERPPSIVLRLRIEWVYRLLREPRRLAKRYLIGNAMFLLRVMRQKLERR